MQFCRRVLCQPCSARVTSPEEDMEYKMGSCMGISHRQAEVPAESLTYRTDSPSSQQNRPLPPVLSDIPVLTGVEENIEAGEQDDKEELEFPHDLLPSLDFSSELNIWESSLGAEISSEEEKHEQVNPLLAGLQHHMEVCQPLVVLDTRPYDCNPVHTDPEPSPWPNITSPHPVTQPLSRPPSKELDRELQEAFQECEEQMASLGILGVTETLATTSEDVEGLWGKTGEDPVNRTESSSLARGEVQPAQSSEGHGNAGTHGRSYPANSQKDTDGFSFRNYILGISSKVKVSESESEIKTTQSADDCSEIKQERKTEFDTQVKMPHLSELERKHLWNETQTETVALNEKDRHGDYNVAIKENTTPVCTKETLLGVVEATESKKDGLDETRSAVKDGDSVLATQEGSNLQVKETGTLSQMHSEEQTEVNTCSELEKKPKKGKKKSRKKKKTVRAKEDLRPVSPPSVITHSASVTNVQLLTQEVLPNVTCAQQPDNVVNYRQQLSPGEKPSPSPPLSSPSSGADHLTYLTHSPASRQAPLQGPPQSDDHNHTSCSVNHCTEENTQDDRNGNAGVINSQNTPPTCLQTTAVCPSASSDQGSDAEMQDAVVTNRAVRPPQKDHRPPLDSQVCVGEDGVKSALEEAVVAVAALPLTTPTMRVLIESKGESVRRDSLKGVASVAFTEGEKAGGEESLKGKDNCVSDGVGTEKGRLLDGPQLSIIPSQETCSLAFSATGQHTPKESCSSKMPHNVVEAETKGQRNICTTDIEISSPEGQAGGKEALFLEAVSSTTPCGLLTGPDCLDHSVVSLEAAEEGGEGDMKHKGGLASEHIIFSQPEGSVGGVSSAETEMCPPTDVAESLLKPQYWSEQIPTITESLCIEKDHSSQCWQEQQNAADLPPSAPSERSSSRTNGELRTEGNRNVISVEAQPSVDGTCEESSITQEEKTRIHVIPLPQTTSARTSIKQESNDIQQVAPECGTFEARTAKASSEYQVPVHKGKQAMSSVGLHVCDYSGSKNKMHFEDVKNLPVLATDFDSLPPLTVRESLQHPVVETSYIFQDFLNNNKAEISTSVADRKDEPPSQRPPGGEPGIKDLRINLNDDNSNLKKNTLDSKSMDETHSELLQCTSNKNQNDEEYLALTQNAICEPDHLKVQPLPDNVLNLLGAEEESDKLPVESELPLSLPAEGDVPVDLEKRESSQNLPFCPAPPAAGDDDACRHLENVFTEVSDLQLDLVASAAAEIATTTHTDAQPPTQLDGPTLRGRDPSDPLKATFEDNVYLQEDAAASDMSASRQLISASERSASDHAFVLQPSGPMLNHLEVIADCNILTPEKTDAFKADGGVMEVPGTESGELSMMSVPQSDIGNRNDTAETDILINKCMINDIMVESVSPGMAKTESDGVISQPPPESDFTKVVCEPPTKDDLNKSSRSPRSDLPGDACGQDAVKEKSAAEDETYGGKRWVEGSTDNRQETDNNGLEMGKAPQQTNGQDNEAFEEVSGQNTESLLDDTKKEGKTYDNASDSPVKTSSFSDSHPEAPENSAEGQTGRESAYDKCFCQNLTETLQCSSERDPLQSDAVPAQAQSNCLAPQQALFPGINLVAEKSDSFVGNSGLFGSQTEAMIDAAKREDGTEASQVCFSHLASISNDDGLDSERSAIADVSRKVDSYHVGDGKLRLDENKLPSLSVGGTADLLPGTELLSELGGKGQEENNPPAVCHGAPETSTSTDISVVPASQEYESFPVCTSEVSAVSDDIYTEALKSGNEAKGGHTCTLPESVWQRETVDEKDPTAAKSNSSDTEECEIPHTVGESLDLQSLIVTPSTQNDEGAAAPAKCSTEENTAGAKHSAVSEKRAIKKEGMETKALGDLQEDSGTGAIKVSDFSVCGSSPTTEATGCNTEEGVGALKAVEHHDSLEFKRTPDVISVSSVISSKCSTDSSRPVALPTQSETICDQTVFSKSEDTVVVDPVVAPPEDGSLPKGPSCDATAEQKTVNTETEDVSETIAAGLRAQGQSTVWIEALKEAAACCQSKHQNTMVISSPLPSLESPQLDFHTPTEEVQEEIPPQPEVVEPSALPESLKSTELPEPTQPSQSTKGELQTESDESKLTDQIQKEDLPPRERSDVPPQTIASSQVVEDASEPEPANSTPEFLDAHKGEKPEPPGTREPEPLITEAPEGEVAEATGEQSLKFGTEAFPEPSEVLPDSRPSHADCPQPLASKRHILSALPPHLHDTDGFPAPLERPTPAPLPTPPASPSALASSAAPTADPCVHPASVPCHPAVRSSDSDGAFETPEATTPVKTASPTEPRNQDLPSEKVSDVLAHDTVCDLTSDDLPLNASPIVFDEDKPIAASGTYNIELLATEGTGHTLTRSLSLQGGELDNTGLLDGSTAEDFRPHSESFSVGTESTPGTLLRPKKVRPSSLKKKPLLRQHSNPESPRAASSGSTPEIKKRTKAQIATPQDEVEASATLSPGGTLRKTRKSRVETPPPVPEEKSINQETPVITALPLCQEEIPPPESPPGKRESPIPPTSSYKWDPDNFENIDPFKTGGSKIANSPILGRKDPVCAPITPPPVNPCVSEAELCVAAPSESGSNPEEQPIIPKNQSVRLEFDYTEENSETSHQASSKPKKVGKKPGGKMPLRKPKLGLKKAPAAQTEQLDNNPPVIHNGNEEAIPVPTASYNFEPDKWEDPNYNPFVSKKCISNSPKLPRPSYCFDPNNFDDSLDPFRSSNMINNSPPKASASFEISSNDYENDNDNDNIGELEDQNQNKPAKKKKTPIKSKSRGVSSLCCLFNTFRVKRSPKKTPLSSPSQDAESPDEPPSHLQDDHATDEEKLASSTSQKWASLHDADLDSVQHDFPEPCDLTSFVNENSLSPPAPVQDYEIEYMEKIGSSSAPLSVNKPSLYLKLDSVSDNFSKNRGPHGSEPSSPCTGSFEEMEAQITAGMKTPVLSSRAGPEGSAGDKGRKRESEALNTERNEQGPLEAHVPEQALPDSLSECDDPLQYLEPDLAETNPTAFAQKLQEELVLAALRIEALQRRDVVSSMENAVSKSCLYSRPTDYIEGESPHLPKDLDHSLGIAREEVVSKEKEVLEWKRKYEDSRQEVMEMRRIVAEYEKTIAQMIEDDQKEKSLSHHTIQQLIMEKDQALSDLNSVEKSLADLFRRYEKMKDVLEGFRKNEDVLKKCAQEYLSRVRKEEQRYQALKIHAEEKLDKANADIAHVRVKAKQEQVAYQASLRKEQMKVDSLERTLEQKNREIEELTKICDELIAKMGKS
ncbi:uncharacterized protein tacc2 isoform X3 [Takifugu flavidus]|uniref:uncharacterized protein tacc2 isoform X3 n=1 Tax=Takifugu flavidus TaxID=433684 RepID=UPI002543FF20|nr:uncharacterized protein tacc2 isoform X3 [Takifugu flavidus]